MIVALIDIASDFIRLTIAERFDRNDLKIIDVLKNKINLMHDITNYNEIMPQNIYNIQKILKDYIQIIHSYDIDSKNIYLISTKSISKAANKDLLIDRIKNQTNLDMNIMDSIEENHLNFISFKKFIKKSNIKDSSSLIIELGQSGSEVIFYKSSNILIPINSKIGIYGIAKFFENSKRNKTSSTISYIRSEIEYLKKEISPFSSNIEHFFLFGKTLRIIAEKFFNQNYKKKQNYYYLDNKKFKETIQILTKYSFSELMKSFDLNIHDTEMFFYAILYYNALLEEFNPKFIGILNLTTGTRLLQYYLLEDRLSGLFDEKILPSLEFMLNKYNCEKEYAEYIRIISEKFFEKTINQHNLGMKEKIYLQIASTLLQIGRFISHSDYFIHSKYIIENSMIFGLNNEDLNIIGLIIKYSFLNIDPSDQEYMFLDIKRQVIVKKVSSIIKISIYIENTFLRKINDFDVNIDKSSIYISFKKSYSYFISENINMPLSINDIFGYKIIID